MYNFLLPSPLSHFFSPVVGHDENTQFLLFFFFILIIILIFIIINNVNNNNASLFLFFIFILLLLLFFVVVLLTVLHMYDNDSTRNNNTLSLLILLCVRRIYLALLLSINYCYCILLQLANAKLAPEKAIKPIVVSYWMAYEMLICDGKFTKL